MDWGYKAALTAALVAAVMMAARLFDRRAAGLLAGAPVITAPALMWISYDQGAAFAARAAMGSVAACAVAPLFAATYIQLARNRSASVAGAGALAVCAAGAALLAGLKGNVVLLLAAAALSAAAVFAWLGSLPRGTWVRPLRGEPWLSAGLAGAVSALVSILAFDVGPYWLGVLSSLPLISCCALVQLHRAGSQADLRRFAHGYVLSLLAKAVFAGAFGVLAPAIGVGASLAASTGLGLAAMGSLVGLHRRLHASERLASVSS